ncbi:MAG: acyl-CoA dehydrogenase family protein [Candidatus Lambdaproteobacteria bacterium]|nr:acyl-CoA dehydrogenase family protein [Candidatus Lambdaproteobacteria bacterium]
MNVNDSPEQAGLRADMRAWIREEVPASLKDRPQSLLADESLTKEEWKPLLDVLAKRGLLAPAWPKPYGGAGFDVGQMIVFNEEWIRGGLPMFRSDGIDKIGPTIIAAGSEEQKQRFLPRILTREIIFAQGYSEPGAGSDLASLSTRADRSEGGFLVNGQKIWTSGAHLADWMYVLARTDQNARPKQKGISLLIFDARNSKGFTISPIVSIDGFHHFNQTFYDNLFIPENQVIGGVNNGWRVANILLGHERFSHPAGNPQFHEWALGQLKKTARELPAGEGTVWDDPGLRRKIVQLEMDVDCLRYIRYRTQTQIAKTGNPGHESSIFKFYGGELLQAIIEAHAEVAGPGSVNWEAEPFGEDYRALARRAMRCRGYTIAGGTAEVQRNIVAKRVLQLPNARGDAGAAE